MAIYEFRCKKCMKITTKSLPISSSKRRIRCDFCGEESEKIVSKNTFTIKGYSEKNGYSKGEK
jgi:putative FmdB family regulatory protein